MTERTKQKIAENVSILCTDFGFAHTDDLTQMAINPVYANQARLLNALTWTAEDVEAQVLGLGIV